MVVVLIKYIKRHLEDENTTLASFITNSCYYFLSIFCFDYNYIYTTDVMRLCTLISLKPLLHRNVVICTQID